LNRKLSGVLVCKDSSGNLKNALSKEENPKCLSKVLKAMVCSKKSDCPTIVEKNVYGIEKKFIGFNFKHY